jgi:DNA primase
MSQKNGFGIIRGVPLIVKIVSKHVDLRKSGEGYIGNCPFHIDEMPSLLVMPRKNAYYCFTCGDFGNEISFIMQLKKCSFDEAIKIKHELMK